MRKKNQQLVASLIPRQFNMIEDKTKSTVYGLIVDEVPDETLIVYAKNKPVTVLYSYIPILLLKDHQRLTKLVDSLTARIEALEKH